MSAAAARRTLAAAVDAAAEREHAATDGNRSPKTPAVSGASGGSGIPASADRKSGAVYGKMKALAGWMRANDLPHNRKALTPFVATGLLSVEHIAAAVERDEEAKLARAFLMFSPEDAERCRSIATRAAPGAAARAGAARPPRGGT